MKQHQLDLIKDFSEKSKVWVYQASRPLSKEEISTILFESEQFVKSWTAHNLELKAESLVLENLFLCLIVDETNTNASGCSIDSSVAFIRQLGTKMNIEWFDRLTFVYKGENEEIKLISKDNLPAALSQGLIEPGTLFFNTLVKNKKELVENWEVPLEVSWHNRFILD